MEAAHGVVVGFDVGRYSHHMTAIDAHAGEVTVSRPVGQDESEIRSALEPYAGTDAIAVVDIYSNNENDSASEVVEEERGEACFPAIRSPQS